MIVGAASDQRTFAKLQIHLILAECRQIASRSSGNTKTRRGEVGH
jgi:hypothetical protein